MISTIKKNTIKGIEHEAFIPQSTLLDCSSTSSSSIAIQYDKNDCSNKKETVAEYSMGPCKDFTLVDNYQSLNAVLEKEHGLNYLGHET